VAFGDTQLVGMLERGPMSVDVVFNGNTTRGFFGTSESGSEYGGVSPAPMLDQATGADLAVHRSEVFVYAGRFAVGGPLASLGEDDTITVDGTAYHVRTFGPTEDGRIWRIRLV
jgi:hypothetical protein